jgi:putative hydrolase of the HAD superfamily
VAAAFLVPVLGHNPDPAQAAALVEAYLSEWNTAVAYPPGVADLVGDLADHFRLAVVTNTHQADLVPAHLSAMGIAGLFEAVVTSVEVGWRKPHPAIYAAALQRLGITAGNAVFVGDSYIADYVGPTAVGLTAFLIDPGQQHSVAPGQRLSSLHELPAHLKPLTGPGFPRLGGAWRTLCR